MSCCACDGIAEQFGEKTARRELKRYRRKGARKTTRLLLDAIRAEAPEATSLLDVGGGVGAIQHALVGDGYTAGTSVDASPAYLAAARAEAERQGYAAQMTYHVGDAIDRVPALDAADVVTLDRVVCCYPDAEALVGITAAKARRVYALILPRAVWFNQLAFRLTRLFMRFRGSTFQPYVHPPATLDGWLRHHGFTRRHSQRTFLWHVWTYRREAATEDAASS